MTAILVVVLLFFALALAANLLNEENQSDWGGHWKKGEMRIKRVRASILIGVFWLAGMGIGGPPVRAELMWGKVEAIYNQGRALKIKKFVPRKMDFDELKIAVSLSTNLNELATVEELRPGDEVLVDAERDKKGKWVATFIELRERYKNE